MGIQAHIEGIDAMMRVLEDMQKKAERLVVGGYEYNRTCAVRFVQLLKVNILSQEHMGNYPAYKDTPGYDYSRYEAWKMKHFPGKGWWQLRMDFHSSISSWKQEREHKAGGQKAAWVAGVTPGSVNTEGKSIEMYAYVNEVGGTWPGRGGKPVYFHPRPIVAPTRNEFMSQWNGLGRNAHRHITVAWGKNV